MITPPRMKSGTAKIGVELAPEKVLFKSWTTEPPFPIKKIGAIEPRIMLTPIGMDTAIAIRKTTNTNNAGIILLLLSPGQLLLLRLSSSVQSLLILFH